MAKKKDTGLTVHIVLDRSGSMDRVREETVSAVNVYLDTLRKDKPDAVVSLTLFDSEGIDTIITDQQVASVKNLTADDYIPRSLTPLLDAVGKCSASLTAATGKNKALVIVTDGLENFSREYTKDAIKVMLTEKQEKDGWLVQFLGANIDAFAAGASIGAHAGNTMQFNQTATGLRASFTGSASAALRYARSGGSLAEAAYTDAEREAATEEE